MKAISALLVLATALSVANAALTPLHTSSRWILDTSNKRFKLRCINWAGHMEAHIPEGLQHNTIDNIVQIIADGGFNCVRLTFSIDMTFIANTTIASSFATLASRTGADQNAISDLWNRVQSKNPWIKDATIIDAFARIIDTLGSKDIRVMLDNHNSHASWCCNLDDGNGWWKEAPAPYFDNNQRFFITQDWTEGLAFMARFSKDHPAVAGIGIRNEIRETPVVQSRDPWYDFVARGAKAVHDANADLLIAIGGALSSTDASFLRSRPFDRAPYGDKVVWEWHTYTFSPTWVATGWTRSCGIWHTALGGVTGFLLEQNKAYTGPLWLSEFGFPQAGGPDSQSGIPDEEQYRYIKCLVEYATNNDGDWALWALQGNYYVRDGQVDYEEGWGLLNKEWTAWKNPKVKELLGGMWKVTQGP